MLRGSEYIFQILEIMPGIVKKDLSNNNITLNKLIKSSGKCNPKTKTNFSFGFHLMRKVILFTNIDTNTKYVCLQTSVNT